jgi:RNA polymerase sigma factor (sigma-70 family)
MNILENEIYDNDTCSDIEETTGYFEGIVDVYDETFYVNTLTNVGLESVLKKVEPLINKMCSKTYISGYAFEDIKQELNIMVIQGISKYDPAKGTKLSTFLQNHLRKKMISKLRSVNKMSNDSSSISFTSDPDYKDAKIKRVREEILFSSCTPDNIEDPSMRFENTISDDDGLYGSTGLSFGDKEFELTLRKISKDLDPDTARIIELLYYEDLPINKAAEAVGLTGSAASMRLKKLEKNESFRMAFSEFVKKQDED